LNSPQGSQLRGDFALGQSTGYHRQLLTTVALPAPPTPPPPSALGCTLLIAQLLPAGAYVDSYELQQLSAFGGMPSNARLSL
jgi:hypothetical protein